MMTESFDLTRLSCFSFTYTPALSPHGSFSCRVVPEQPLRITTSGEVSCDLSLDPTAPDAKEHFMQLLHELHMELWQPHYAPPSPVLDGDSWEVSLTFSGGETRTFEGVNAYPASFDKLMQIFGLSACTDDLAADILIRPYRPEDQAALAAIHDPARMQELTLAGLQAAFLPLSVAAEREGLYDYPHLDVATLDDEPVGFVAYNKEELAWLYVLPDLQRRGIGRKLVAHALAQEPGICEIEALEGNLPAKSLYESCGFHLEKMVHGKMPGNEGFAVSVYRLSREVK